MLYNEDNDDDVDDEQVEVVRKDVLTRFTVSEALQVFEDLLADDDTLKTRTTVLPADIMSLTRL